MASLLDIEVVQNNDLTIIFTAKDNAGNPIDITDFTIKWQVKKSYKTTALITKSTGSGITIFNPTCGQFEIVLNAADTVNIPPGSYFHEAVVTDTAGKSVTLTSLGLDVGVFRIREQYAVQS